MSAPDAGNPYPGLRPFREDEEHLFFGREHQVDRMVDRLAATRFLAVVGTSGSGKSSLVNCGLRPALHRGLMAGAGIQWKVAQFRPGHQPIRAMAEAIAAAAGMKSEAGAPFQPADFIETTLRTSPLGLLDAFEQAAFAEGTNLLVVADQFEELFRYRDLAMTAAREGGGAAEEATAFVNLLLEVARRKPVRLFVVLTMRSDYLGDCAQFHGLPEAINSGQYLVPRLSREERRLAIAGPAGVAGARISPVLLTRLVNDVGDNPDQLSILQHALNRTWACWAASAAGPAHEPIELTHYQDIGTMAHALDHHAEQAWAELTGPQQGVAERVFRALTDRSTDPRGIRRPTPIDQLCAITQAPTEVVAAVIEVFRRPDRSFLLPPAGDPLSADKVVDISHESLMRVWQRLARWADDEREAVKTYQRLVGDAELHASTGRNLLTELNLQLALQWKASQRPNAAWAARYHPADFESVMRYLEASRQAYEAERGRRRRRLITVRAGFAALLAVAVLVGAYTTSLWLRADEQESLVSASSLLVRAKDANSQGRIDRALLLAVASMQSHPTDEAKSELVEWLQQAPRRVLQGHEAPISAMAFDASSRRLASLSDDGQLQIWDVDGGNRLQVTPVPRSPRQVVAFAADGRSVQVGLWLERGLVEVGIGPDAPAPATGDAAIDALAGAVDQARGLLATASGSDRAGTYGISIWRSKTEEAWGEIRGIEAQIVALAFGPGGRVLAGVDERGMVRLWHVDEDPRLIRLLAAYPLPREASEAQLRFSPDGQWLASAAAGSLLLWDVARARLAHTLAMGEAARGAAPSAMAFSPDSRLLALAWPGIGAGLWDTQSGRPIGAPMTLASELRQLAFSPDGRLLAGGYDDGTFWLWNLHGGQVSEDLTGPDKVQVKAHTRPINALVFSPDSRLLASGGDDQLIAVWNVAADRPARGTLDSGPAAATSVAWSPDGRVLAYTSEDGFFGHWRADDRNRARAERTSRPKEQLTTIVFSKDGKRLAFGSRSGLVEIASVVAGAGSTTERRITLGEDVVVSALAFRPTDSRWLACADLNGRILLLDLDADARPAAELKHPEDEMVRAIAFSPDGRTLVSADNKGRLIFWSVGDDGRMVPLGEPVQAHESGATSLAFDPGGRWLYSGGLDGKVRRWDADTRRASGRPIEIQDRVMSVAVSPQAKTLAAGLSGGLIAVWDLERGKPLLQALPGHRRQDGAAGDFTFGVAFSPDGSSLASVGSDGKLRLWDGDVRQDRLRARACEVTHRALTDEEWPSGTAAPPGALEPCGPIDKRPSRP